MKKIILILQREYLTRVKRRSFLISTLLVPLVIIGFYGLIFFISMDESHVKNNRFLVIDDRGIMNGLDTSDPNIPGMDVVQGKKLEQLQQSYKTEGYEGLLVIPKDSSAPITLYSTEVIPMTTVESLKELMRGQVMDKKWKSLGVNPEDIARWKNNIHIKNMVDQAGQNKETQAGIGYMVSFACGLLIYFMMVIYGTQVMRGVSEEKINRIAEVIISSTRPFQLMLGKILGIGAVGLTQFGIWILLIIGVQAAITPALTTIQSSPSLAAQTMELQTIQTALNGIQALPLGLVLVSFAFFFLFGYLLYASMFAAVGSIVSDDQQEAQQMMFPILMPIILGFVILTKALNEPHSTEAVFFSIFPLTSPIVMMGRITFGVPGWQLAVSMLSLVISFLLFTWFTAKIYRTGILMYGKKITWREMLRWGFRK
jgi:ABC-2 type transport system permease protein